MNRNSYENKLLYELTSKVSDISELVQDISVRYDELVESNNMITDVEDFRYRYAREHSPEQYEQLSKFIDDYLMRRQ